MTIQAFYPVFANGQVLTSGHLNNIVTYLEPQDRLTRSNLIGIGIACGLDVDWKAPNLDLSAGVAVTSEGYLITQDAVRLDRFRPYTVPVPSADQATPAERQNARYPFLFNGNTQHQVFELLPEDFVPAPGETAPTALSNSFVSDKVVMLFLERNRESLKNCDVNDCSDKGSEMNLTLRRLLISKSLADKILVQEAEIAKRPVQRAGHPRLNLPVLTMEKVNPSGTQLKTLDDLYTRWTQVATRSLVELHPALRDTFVAYLPLLADIYPQDRYPDGPFPQQYFAPLLYQWNQTPALGQYAVSALQDLTDSYNEFTQKAAEFDAECRPNAGRFPLHILVGEVKSKSIASGEGPKKPQDLKNFDPLSLTNGPVPTNEPRPWRHHFVASLALDNGSDQRAELRSLFNKMVLQGQCFFSRDLLDQKIRLTPSRWGDAISGDKAIPFYYRFDVSSDLFANWSWRKTRRNLLSTVWSHQFTPDDATQHPLAMRLDEVDFVRIEGVVGKPLGTAMANLIAQKRRLGVDFAIEPVMVPYLDFESKRDQESLARALAAAQQLIMCKMRDLDVIFVMFMMAIIAFIVLLIQRLGPQKATSVTTHKAVPQTTDSAGMAAARRSPAGATLAAGAMTGETFRLSAASAMTMRSAMRLNPTEDAKLEETSSKLVTGLRQGKVSRETMILSLATEAQGKTELPNESVAKIYSTVRDDNSGGELLDRVKIAAAKIDPQNSDAVAASIYPSMALMARAEEVVELASVETLADFKQDKFRVAMQGFSDSYTNYAEVADTSTEVPAVAAINTDIVAQTGTVSAMATQTGGAAFFSEFGKRIQAIFAEQILQGYAPKHPGMEHRGGVPIGGTFILLYADRRGLDDAFKNILDTQGGALHKLYEKFGGAEKPSVNTGDHLENLLLTSRPLSDDLLDEFVVFGDFCTNTYCCDADCGEGKVSERILSEGKSRPEKKEPDIAVTPVTERPSPNNPTRDTQRRRASLSGSVFLKAAGNRLRPLKKATLVVVSLETDKTQEKPLNAATFKLELPPGKYKITATFSGKSSKSEVVSLKAGTEESVRLIVS